MRMAPTCATVTEGTIAKSVGSTLHTAKTAVKEQKSPTHCLPGVFGQVLPPHQGNTDQNRHRTPVGLALHAQTRLVQEMRWARVSTWSKSLHATPRTSRFEAISGVVPCRRGGAKPGEGGCLFLLRFRNRVARFMVGFFYNSPLLLIVLYDSPGVPGMVFTTFEIECSGGGRSSDAHETLLERSSNRNVRTTGEPPP